MKQKPGLHFEGSVTNLLLQNSVFSDIKVGTSNSIVNAQQVSVLTFSNCSFTLIGSSEPDDEDNLMVNIQTFGLDQALDSSITGITVDQSTISFLHFNSIIGSLPAPVTIDFSDLTFINCAFSSIISILEFGNLETEEDITYQFSRISFSNITFDTSGKILSFQHQLTNQISISDSNFTDIQAGEIYIESANKQNLTLSTKVGFTNCIFSNVDANYGSLMRINEGADVTIQTSSFTNIYTLEEGSVIFAGYRNALVQIYDSTFTNNHANVGGVFNIESSSVIKLYN
jgi:hypothetical protein